MLSYLKKYWMYGAGAIGLYVVYSAFFAADEDPGNATDGIVAQNTAMALKAQERAEENTGLMMQLQTAVALSQIEAKSQFDLARVMTEAQLEGLSIEANTTAYMHNVDAQLHQSEYAQGLLAAQALAAMQLKGAVAGGAAASLAAMTQSFMSNIGQGFVVGKTNQTQQAETDSNTLQALLAIIPKLLNGGSTSVEV